MFPQKDSTNHLSTAWVLQTKAYGSFFPRVAMVKTTNQSFIYQLGSPCQVHRPWVFVHSHTRVHPHTQHTCCCNVLLRYFLPFIQRALQRINQLSFSSRNTAILQTRNLCNSEIQTGGGFPHSVQIKGKRGKKNKIMPHIQCKGLFISKLCRWPLRKNNNL